MNTEIKVVKLPLPLVQKMMNAAKNNLGLEFYCVGISAVDTEFTYSIRVNKRLRETTYREARAFVVGFEIGVN